MIMAKNKSISGNGLFATKDALRLYNRLEEARRLFHREKVGQAFIDVFNALLEAEIKCSEASNNILFAHPNDLSSEERITTSALMADLSNKILGAIVCLNSFSWAFDLTEKGKQHFKMMDEAVAKANSFEELHELLCEIKD